MMRTYRIDYTAKTKGGEITGLQRWYQAESASSARRMLLSDIDLKADICATCGQGRLKESDITGVRIDRAVEY